MWSYEPRIYWTSFPSLTKLETGEMDDLMILEESVLKKRQDDNSSLEVIYPKDGN